MSRGPDHTRSSHYRAGTEVIPARYPAWIVLAVGPVPTFYKQNSQLKVQHNFLLFQQIFFAIRTNRFGILEKYVLQLNKYNIN